MEDNIPINLMLGMMLASDKDKLEITSEGEDIRIKGQFSIKGNPINI